MSVRERPKPIGPLENRPSVHQPFRLEDQEAGDDSTEKDVHGCENNVAPQSGVLRGDLRTNHGDDFLNEANRNDSYQGPRYRAIPPTMIIAINQIELNSVN